MRAHDFRRVAVDPPSAQYVYRLYAYNLWGSKIYLLLGEPGIGPSLWNMCMQHRAIVFPYVNRSS